MYVFYTFEGKTLMNFEFLIYLYQINSLKNKFKASSSKNVDISMQLCIPSLTPYNLFCSFIKR